MVGNWQEITKDKPSLKIFFSSCQHVKINPNFQNTANLEALKL